MSEHAADRDPRSINGHEVTYENHRFVCMICETRLLNMMQFQTRECPGPAVTTPVSSGWSRGAWMQTFTGRQFFPLDPRPEEIDPVDIAHALSLICRYGGHTNRFYSVAEHCLRMSLAVPPEAALWALLHDATEAYVGDMVRPLKQQIPQYREIENRLMGSIAVRFNLPSPMPAAVKDADNRILLDERAVLLSTTPEAWDVEDLEPLGVPVMGLNSTRVERLYLDRLEQLWPDGSDR